MPWALDIIQPTSIGHHALSRKQNIYLSIFVLHPRVLTSCICDVLCSDILNMQNKSKQCLAFFMNDVFRDLVLIYMLQWYG